MAYGFGTSGNSGGSKRSTPLITYKKPTFAIPWSRNYVPSTGFPSLMPRIAAGNPGQIPWSTALAGMPTTSNPTGAAGPPPGYSDLLNSLLAGLAGPQAGITPEEGLAQARKALIQYGGVPAGLSGLHNLGGAFDNATSKLASENTSAGISLLARLNQAHADQNRYIVNRLAAHGILGSGETGFQVGREQTNYARAQADASSKLLDYLSGINSGIAQYLQWKAMMDALANAQAGYGSTGGGGTTVSSGGGGTTGAAQGATPGYWQYGSGFVQTPYYQSSRGHGTRFIAL